MYFFYSSITKWRNGTRIFKKNNVDISILSVCHCHFNPTIWLLYGLNFNGRYILWIAAKLYSRIFYIKLCLVLHMCNWRVTKWKNRVIKYNLKIITHKQEFKKKLLAIFCEILASTVINIQVFIITEWYGIL